MKTREWIEFWLSAVVLVDWYYAILGKHTAVEKKMLPLLCKRRQIDAVLATAEHVVYLIIAYLGITWGLPLTWVLLTGAFVIAAIIPFEFIAYRKYAIFRSYHRFLKSLDDRELAITSVWNMLNIWLYWLLGIAIGLFL